MRARPGHGSKPSLARPKPLEPAAFGKAALGRAARTSTRQRWVFVAVVLACVAMVGLQAWREWVAREDQGRQTEKSLVNLASSLVQHADDTFGMADAALVSLVERVETDGVSPPALARLDRLLAAQLATVPGVHDFVVYDEGGNWLATSMPAKGGNNADRDYFRRRRDDPDLGMHIGSLFRSRSTGRWTVGVTRRWQHADGRFGGVVLAMIDLAHFVDHFATFDLGPDSSITLETMDSILLARRPFVESEIGRDLSNGRVYKEVRKHPAGSYEAASIIDGVERFVGYCRSARYPLLIVAAMSSEQALASWRADAELYVASASVLAVIVGLLCLHLSRQVGRRQAAEGQVRESEARYRLVAENANDLIVVKASFDGPRAYVSPACRAMLGYEPEELAALPIERHVHPDDLERVAAEYASLAPASSVTSVHRLRHKAGHWVWVETVFRLVAEGGGQRVIAAARDITARHRLEAEREVRERDLARFNAELDASNADLHRLAEHLEQARDRAERASRAKSRFLAGMSHELRTPLNGVLGYAQLLRLEGGLSRTQLGRVDSMLSAGSHLLQMINCVLDLSEIEAEHVTLRMAAVDLRSAAKVCLDLVRSAAEAKRLTLRCVTAADLPGHVTTDATRLRQVLLNLLGNAVKFTSEGAVELRLGLAQDGAQDGRQGAATLRIEVADTGPGISAEQRHRLFQDFDRLDVEDTSTVEGTGLGLAISARLAVLLGGRLGHEDNPGGGSVFWLELPAGAAPVMEGVRLDAPPLDAPPLDAPRLDAPRLDAPRTAEAAALSPAAAPGGPPGSRPAARPLRVLLADDVPMNRDIARAFLVAAGHKVDLAENGAEAVAKAAAETFDVILMDVRMPVMNGFDAAARIRGLKGARGRVPIVALTAQSFAGQVEESRKAGMDAHLTKPFTPDTLLEAVAHWGVAGRRPGTGLPAPGPPAQEAAPADDAPAARTVEEATPGLAALDAAVS